MNHGNPNLKSEFSTDKKSNFIREWTSFAPASLVFRPAKKSLDRWEGRNLTLCQIIGFKWLNIAHQQLTFHGNPPLPKFAISCIHCIPTITRCRNIFQISMSVSETLSSFGLTFKPNATSIQVAPYCLTVNILVLLCNCANPSWVHESAALL